MDTRERMRRFKKEIRFDGKEKVEMRFVEKEYERTERRIRFDMRESRDRMNGDGVSASSHNRTK